MPLINSIICVHTYKRVKKCILGPEENRKSSQPLVVLLKLGGLCIYIFKLRNLNIKVKFLISNKKHIISDKQILEIAKN